MFSCIVHVVEPFRVMRNYCMNLLQQEGLQQARLALGERFGVCTPMCAKPHPLSSCTLTAFVDRYSTLPSHTIVCVCLSRHNHNITRLLAI